MSRIGDDYSLLNSSLGMYVANEWPHEVERCLKEGADPLVGIRAYRNTQKQRKGKRLSFDEDGRIGALLHLYAAKSPAALRDVVGNDQAYLSSIADSYKHLPGALMRRNAKNRKAPRHSATSFVIGKSMRGLDGKQWKVVAAGKSRRWARCPRKTTSNSV